MTVTRHRCHADGCTVEVAPKYLMCGRHWRMVPLPVQALVWEFYRPGQEIDKQPSAGYLDAHMLAVNTVAVAEGRPEPFSGVADKP